MLGWIWDVVKPEHVQSVRPLGGRFGDFEIITNKRTYRGSCTVWHTYPGGSRCWTPKEAWFANEWKRAVWKLENEEGE